MPDDKVVVSVIQASPVFLDLNASLDKAESLVKEAAAQDAKVVTFGETWLPGYPAYLDICVDVALWDHAPTKEVFARLAENSVTVPGPAAERLAGMARDNGVVLVMSVHERSLTNTLYNSLLTFDADGTLLNHHRKLVPTYTERLVWGPGQTAETLKAVPTQAGRVGGTICWEHWMPLLRQAMHDSGEQIHVAVWPTAHEMHQIASRHYAFEGRCYVLAAGSLLRAGDIPAGLTLKPELADTPDTLVMTGGSAIIAPDGSYLAGPVYGEETILTAELDMAAITREKMTLDTSGHYSRPDLFTFAVKSDIV